MKIAPVVKKSMNAVVVKGEMPVCFDRVETKNLPVLCMVASNGYQKAIGIADSFLSDAFTGITAAFPEIATSKEYGNVFMSSLKKAGVLAENAKMGEVKNKDRRPAERTDVEHGHLNTINRFITYAAYHLNEGPKTKAPREASEPSDADLLGMLFARHADNGKAKTALLQLAKILTVELTA